MAAVDINDTSHTFFGAGVLSPRAMLETADGRSFDGEDGDTWTVELKPPLEEEELAQYEAVLAWRVPPEIRELLRLCRGVKVGWWDISFEPKLWFHYRDHFPMAVRLCHNASEDCWVVDVHPETGTWRGVYFISNDPPVLIVQSTSLGAFLSDLFAQLTDNHVKPIDSIEHERPADIFMKNPGLLHESELEKPEHAELKQIVGRLNPGHEAWIADLRMLRPGTGLTWHRQEEGVHVKRVSHQPVFVVTAPRPKPKKGFFGRLFTRD